LVISRNSSFTYKGRRNKFPDVDDGTTFMASTQVEWSNENYASSENSDAVRSRCFVLRFLWIVERHFCELGLADV